MFALSLGFFFRAAPLLSADENSVELVARCEAAVMQWQAAIDRHLLDESVDASRLVIDLQRQILQSARDELPAQFDFYLAANKSYSDTLVWLAETLEEAGDEQSLAIRQELVSLTESRVAATDEHLLASLTEQSRSEVRRAEMLYGEGEQAFGNRDLALALSKFSQSAEILTEHLGATHSTTRNSLAWIPYLHEELGDFSVAAREYIREVELKTDLLGEHLNTAKSLQCLANVLQRSGEFSKAESYFERSLDMRLRVAGESANETAIAHTALGINCMWLGNYAEALPHLQRSQEIVSELPYQARAVAANLQNIALVLSMMGDYSRAEPMYSEALTHAAELPDASGQIHDNLGLLYSALEEFEKAEEHFHSALECYQNLDVDQLKIIASADEPTDLSNDKSSDLSNDELRAALDVAVLRHREPLRKIATVINNLAWLYRSRDQLEHAEFLFNKSLQINQAIAGQRRPEAAACLDNLGWLHMEEGLFDKAAAELEQALAIRTETLGTMHVETAVSLRHLGLLKMSLGEQRQARELISECLVARRRLLDETACVQNERQQLLMNQSLRIALDDWLSVTEDETAYRQVLDWKGAVFLRQASLRSVRSDPELVPLVDELRSIGSRIASMAFSIPSDETKHFAEMKSLQLDREQLESQLTQLSTSYQDTRQHAELTAEDLQAFIAEQDQVALIDFIEYSRFVPPYRRTDETASISTELPPPSGGQLDRQRCFVAFVVTASGPVKRVELGSAEAIDQLVDDYRANYLQRAFAADAALSKTGIELRRLLWEPLETHLGDAKTVLISPDGSLGKLPFAALPGRSSGSYLIEDFATAVIPVPQAITHLFGDATTEPDGMVLAFGGVDYDVAGNVPPAKPKRAFGSRTRAAPAESPVGAGRSYETRLAKYPYLPATNTEVNDLKQTYEDEFGEDGLDVFVASSATEAEFRKQAPRHLFLHMATHGFFAPEELVSSLQMRHDGSRSSQSKSGFVGYDPGVLSGIVLAGANRPILGGDDGVLTALEVGELDLSAVRVAVLSACETGLGKAAGGEGILGIQRAFQVAGARTVVGSLWEVNDDKTSALMRDFYLNLWKEQKFTLEALHEAQLAMLYDKGRGVRISTADNAPDISAGAGRRTSPHFWAAFVLSGDWLGM